MDHLTLFETHRGTLFGIAYRILGTAMDAEDVLQEAFLRWQRTSLPEVDSPKALLATIVTRLSIDQLRSARYHREDYIGPWLPEPLLTSGAESPADAAVRRETLSLGLLHLMEQLTPEQRSVFVLREAFDYEYAEIADVLDTSPANSRQLVSRARRALAFDKPRPPYDRALAEQVVRDLVRAIEQGDTAGLAHMLAADVVHYSDGNGMTGVARRPIAGRPAVIRFFMGLKRLAPADTEIRLVELNGEPALVIRVGGAVYSTLCFRIEGGQVVNTYSVVNPEKLAGLR